MLTDIFNDFSLKIRLPSTSILSTIHDENEHYYLVRQMLAISTKNEHPRANRLASQRDHNQISSTVDPLVKTRLLKKQQKEKSIIVHYTDERCFTHFESKIHQIWNQSFHSISAMGTKSIIGIPNKTNLTKDLVRRSLRPQKYETQKWLR